MTRQKPFTQSARLLRTTLCLIVLMITSQLFPASVLAQSGNAPLNLGTVIQKSTAGAPPPRVYLKLPNEIPIPAPKPPAPAKSETTAEQTAQDGQSATSSQEGNAGQPAAPAAEGSTMEQAPASAQTQPAPAAPVIQPGGIARLHLEALLTDTSPALQRGVNWRIFREERDKNGHLPMLKNVDGGLFDTELEPGSYIIYAGYGYANLTKRIVLEKAGSYSESFNLRAGAVRLNAVATGDVPLDNNILTFDIYKTGGVEESSQDLIVKNVKPEHVVKLTEGTYHIISNYGSSNAKVRGDVEVQAGKLINVTMIHSAAKVTLRLVSEPGGEALANTLWTVLTPGGDVVKRAIGAFPTLALAAGDYTAIAKQNDEIYNRDFSVDSGLDRDIEVLASKAQ